MARPRRSQATRTALVERGLTHFLEHGYHGTGINAVLKAVKVPKGSFYNYFASKEAFVAEVIDHYARRLFETWDAGFHGWPGTALDGLRAAYSLMIGVQAGCGFANGCLIGNLAGEIAANTPACREAMERAFAGWRARLESIVEQGQREGDIRTDWAAADLADVLIDGWEGAQLRAKVEQSADPLKRMVRATLDGLLLADGARGPSVNAHVDAANAGTDATSSTAALAAALAP